MNILDLFKKKEKQQQSKSFTPIVPSGLIAHTEKGYFYIKGKKRFRFVSDRAMVSWDLPVVETIEATLLDTQISGMMGFRDGTIVKDISDSKIYLISDSKRRHIVDPDVLEWIHKEVISIGQKELFVHAEGEKL